MSLYQNKPYKQQNNFKNNTKHGAANTIYLEKTPREFETLRLTAAMQNENQVMSSNYDLVLTFFQKVMPPLKNPPSLLHPT